MEFGAKSKRNQSERELQYEAQGSSTGLLYAGLTGHYQFKPSAFHSQATVRAGSGRFILRTVRVPKVRLVLMSDLGPVRFCYCPDNWPHEVGFAALFATCSKVCRLSRVADRRDSEIQFGCVQS